MSKPTDDEPWNGPEILVPFNEKLLQEIKQQFPDLPHRQAIPMLAQTGLAAHYHAKRKAKGMTEAQRAELYELAIRLDKALMKVWRGLKSPAVKLKYGIQLMKQINDSIETDKYVRSGQTESPRQHRRALYTSMAELQKFVEPFERRQLKGRMNQLAKDRSDSP